MKNSWIAHEHVYTLTGRFSMMMLASPCEILMVSEYFPPRIWGGGELSVYLLARALAKKGHRVDVLTSHPRHKTPVLVKDTQNVRVHEIMNGISIHRILGVKTLNLPLFNYILWREAFHLYGAISLSSFIKRRRIDIIHALNLTSIPSSVATGRYRNIPVVTTINSYQPTCPKGNRLRFGKVCDLRCNFQVMVKCMWHDRRKASMLKKLIFPMSSLYNYLSWQILRSAAMIVDRIIAVSEGVREMLIRAGFPKDKIVVIPNIVDLERFHSKKPSLTRRKLYSLADDDKVILFSGAVFHKMKGSELLVEAMRIIIERVTEAKLLILGKVPRREMELTKRKNLDKHVIIAGFIPNEELPAIYALADVVVFPSIWPEPLSRAMLEACASGKPIVATRVGGTPDIVIDGVNGYLTDTDPKELAEAIVKVLKDEELSRKMGEEGLKIVNSRFTEDVIVSNILNLYREVLKEFV